MEPKISQPNKTEPTALSLSKERDKNIKIRDAISILGMVVCTAYIHGLLAKDDVIMIPANIGIVFSALGIVITDMKAMAAERKRLNILYNEGKI